MGLDLTLCPYDYGTVDWMLKDASTEFGILLYSRISLKRNYELFDSIKELEVITFPKESLICYFQDEGITEMKEDCYGNEFTYIFSDEFKKIKVDKIETTDWNKASIKFIQNLPAKTPIILYWH